MLYICMCTCVQRFHCPDSEMALLWTAETGTGGLLGGPESVVPLTCAGVFIGPVSSQCQHQPTAPPSHSLGCEMSTRQ